jgi:hypothetical protein
MQEPTACGLVRLQKADTPLPTQSRGADLGTVRPRCPMLTRAAELFAEGMTLREIAATLRISKSEACRLRIRAIEDGLLLESEKATDITLQ